MVHQKPEGGTSDPELLGWMDGPSWVAGGEIYRSHHAVRQGFCIRKARPRGAPFAVFYSLFMRERPFTQRPSGRRDRVNLTPVPGRRQSIRNHQFLPWIGTRSLAPSSLTPHSTNVAPAPRGRATPRSHRWERKDWRHVAANPPFEHPTRSLRLPLHPRPHRPRHLAVHGAARWGLPGRASRLPQSGCGRTRNLRGRRIRRQDRSEDRTDGHPVGDHRIGMDRPRLADRGPRRGIPDS